jgi:hypothetical protein
MTAADVAGATTTYGYDNTEERIEVVGHILEAPFSGDDLGHRPVVVERPAVPGRHVTGSSRPADIVGTPAAQLLDTRKEQNPPPLGGGVRMHSSSVRLSDARGIRAPAGTTEVWGVDYRITEDAPKDARQL